MATGILARHEWSLLASVVLLVVLNPAIAIVRWCIPTAIPTSRPTFVADCTTMLQQQLGPGYACVAGGSPVTCTEMVAKNAADFVNLGGDDLYTAGTQYNLVPYVAENYEGLADSTSYYAVAFVNASFCTPGVTLESLRGKRMCSTGYRKTAGWAVPVGTLLQAGVMQPVKTQQDVRVDAQSVAGFFSGGVCAPRITPDGPRLGISGPAYYDGLCTICEANCTEQSPYSDYLGAMRCFLDGAGDVAFVKHTTYNDYMAAHIAEEALRGITEDNEDEAEEAMEEAQEDALRLLCPNGGCAGRDDYLTCNWARVAGRALMGRPGYVGELLAAVNKIAEGGATANSSFLIAARDFGGVQGFPFQKSAVMLKRVPSVFTTFFGPSLPLYQQLRALEDNAVRFCTVSTEEQAMCQRVVAVMNTLNLGFTWGCFQAAGEDQCIAAISHGDATLRAFDSGEAYKAYEDYNLKVIAAEDYGSGTSEYYAVAVVNSEMCAAGNRVNLASLQGKRACFTGYKRSAGWRVPIGFMLGAGIIPMKANNASVANDAESAAAFFSKLCAGRVGDNGPVRTPDNQGALWPPLCTACKQNCTTSDAYYDYAGVLRCLVEGAGDVAFTKHTIVPQFAADGLTPAPWSADRTADSFRLMCPGGGCAPVNQAYKCNLAILPSHAVMVRSDYPATPALKAALITASRTPAFADLVFNPANNPKDLVFKSSTQSLVAINDDTKAFLGAILPQFTALDKVNALDSDGDGDGNEDDMPGAVGVSDADGDIDSDGDDGGHNLSGGDIAGIVIGCVVGGALIPSVVAYLIVQYKYRGYVKREATVDGVAAPAVIVNGVLEKGSETAGFWAGKTSDLEVSLGGNGKV